MRYATGYLRTGLFLRQLPKTVGINEDEPLPAEALPPMPRPDVDGPTIAHGEPPGPRDDARHSSHSASCFSSCSDRYTVLEEGPLP